MKQHNLVEKILTRVAVGDSLAVAVSGGEDSMALLHAVKNAATQRAFSFFVVNIEHGIRGEASVADSAFVEGYCRENGIDFTCFKVQAKEYADNNGLTLEEGARLLRYEVFDKLLADKKCNKVLLAHHRADQAETVLLRIIRGTGITGLRGMSEVNGGYVRPFLDVPKKEISDYVAENKIPFVTDASNFDNDYSRNLIRNEILPALKKISADAETGLVRLSRLAAENEDFVTAYDNPVEVSDGTAFMSIIEGEHRLLTKRRIRRCFEALGVNKDVEERHAELVRGLIELQNGASLDMPFGVKVTREYDKLVFTKFSQKQGFNVPFATGKIAIADCVVEITPYKGEALSKGELIFDLEKIPENAVLRQRTAGDTFTKFGGGTKSLGDYLTDKKIPKRLRDDLIICASDSDVLFIVGVEISDKIKGAQASQKLYKINFWKV